MFLIAVFSVAIFFIAFVRAMFVFMETGTLIALGAAISIFGLLILTLYASIECVRIVRNFDTAQKSEKISYKNVAKNKFVRVSFAITLAGLVFILCLAAYSNFIIGRPVRGTILFLIGLMLGNIAKPLLTWSSETKNKY